MEAEVVECKKVYFIAYHINLKKAFLQFSLICFICNLFKRSFSHWSTFYDMYSLFVTCRNIIEHYLKNLYYTISNVMARAMEYRKELECCVFCLMPKQNEVKLYCKHTFCHDCIEVYCQKIRYNRRCPICRRSFSYYENISNNPSIIILDEDEEDSVW